MKQLSLFFLLCFTSVLYGQMQVTTNSNASQLAQYLAGQGVSISNATLNCPSNGAGFFSNGSTGATGLGISDGVVLTNGAALDAAQPSTFFASTGNLGTGDADLDLLLAPAGLMSTDVCVLEFDITVTGDSLNFSYVFGSEEYNGFVCNGYNDVFGFFITGPDPAGGTYNAENVALISGTTTPVSINTVNNGFPNGTDPGCQTTNTQYYNPLPLTDVSYDGRTQLMTAKAEVVPCATYHFKLAVGDGSPTGFSDDVFDSGVFLQEGSFTSNAVAIGASSILGGSYNYLIEGCLEGVFTFDIFTNGGTNDTIVDFILGGTATNGVDYQLLDEFITFNGNDTTISINIMPINDNIIEGVETIVLYLTSQDCNNSIIDSAVIELHDNIAVQVNPPSDSLCFGDTISISASGADSYEWSPINAVSSVTDSNIFAFPDTTTQLQLITTLGTCIDTNFVSLSVSNLAVVDATIVDESCPGDNDGSITVLVNQNVGPINYSWSNGDTTSSIVGLSPGIYNVNIGDQSGCNFTISYLVDSVIDFLEINIADLLICAGEEVLIQVIDSFDNAQYNWSPSVGLNNTTIPNPEASPEQTTTYVLQVNYNNGLCISEDSITIVVQQLAIAPWFTDTIASVGDVLDLGVDVISATNINGAISYLWTPTANLSSSTTQTTQLTVVENVTYQITAEGDGCADSTVIVVATEIDYDIPNAFTPNNDGVNDVFQIANLSGGDIREFKVYNQWGDLVHNNVNPWDGTYQGVAQPQGVYSYVIRFTNIGQEITESGFITLIY